MESCHNFTGSKFSSTELTEKKKLGYKYILYKKLNSGPALILYITGKCFYSLEGIYIFLSLVSAWKIQKKLRWSCCCRQAYLLGFSTCSCLSKFQFSSLELLLISSCLVLLLLLLLLVFWEHWAALLLGTGRKDLTLETPNSVFDLLLLHSVVWWLLRGLASFCGTGILRLTGAEDPGLVLELSNFLKSSLESAISFSQEIRISVHF